jgi:hypothetical protein
MSWIETKPAENLTAWLRLAAYGCVVVGFAIWILLEVL